MSNKILIISDFHAPYHHPGAMDFLKRLKAEYKPDMVIQIGDLVDQHNAGRWTREMDAEGPNEEFLMAVEAVQ